MVEVSKNDAGRKLAVRREKLYGPCGHEVVPVRVLKRMLWACVQGCPRVSKWTSRGKSGKDSSIV